MKKNETNPEQINSRAFLKTVAKVAAPIAAQGLIASSLNLIDNLMVGNLGELPLNAVGVSVQVFMVFWMLTFGFVSGAATYISQFYGVRDYRNIRRTVGFTLTVVFCFGVIFFLVATIFPRAILHIFTDFPEVIDAGAVYVRTGAPCFLLVPIIQCFTVALRATQQTHLPLIASVTALCSNTILNYILIYGKLGVPALGIQGAALATVLARCIEACILLYIIFVRKNIISGRLSEFFSYSKDLARRVVKNSIPTTINEVAWSLGTAMYIAAFARISITAGAAVQACNTVNGLFVLAAFSIGDAILILVGQKLGEGETELAYAMAKKLEVLACIVGVLMGILMLIFSRPILGLFDFTEEGLKSAWYIMIVYGTTLGMDVYSGTLIAGTLRCGGDTRFPMFTELATIWCIGVPAAFITALVFHWPVYFAVLATKTEQVVKCIILTKRFFSKKWVKNVIHDVK